MRELRTYYIETYGCQMNFSDAELIETLLAGEGLRRSEGEAGADLVLINTCGVREHAEQRVLSRLNKMKHRRRINPRSVIVVCGCMAQRMGDGLIEKAPWVDLVLGPDSYRRLPELLARIKSGGNSESALEFDRSETYSDIAPLRGDPSSAWVPVTRGCDNFCSYCIVPYTRGRERSIPVDHVIREIEWLHNEGYREVTLLGQNVNSYRDGEVDFADLLDRAAETGIGWVRFLTSHPRDLSRRVLEVMADRENVCSHLHLPLQSGSDRVLHAMNRGYTASWYMEKVDMARELVPDVSITTDLIFGFPGETTADFEATLSVMERARFDFAFLYRYSEREGTPACSFPDPVPEKERIDRLKSAIELQNTLTAERNARRIGSVHTVLVKGPSKDGRGWYGFTDTSVPAVVTGVDGSTRPGMFIRMRVESSTGTSLVGRCI